MFKKLILILGLISSVFVFGQKPVDLPTITPPSPEAFAFTKYGDLPINESTGKMTYSLPIYTYKAGRLTVPISLNYMGNGVKINDPSTWTGVNWTLNAGGVINRTVHHKPDEYVTQRIFQSDIDALNLSNDLDDAYLLKNYFELSGNTYDTQPDIFSFSFPGYSGSFYLDENFNPVQMKGDFDVKIEIIGSQTTKKEKLFHNKYFTITTPDGIIYHFGQNETQITEKIILGSQHTISSPAAITSFYLFKIEHPNSEEVLLEYLTTSSYNIKIGESESDQRYLTMIAYGGTPHNRPTTLSLPSGQVPNPGYLLLDSEGFTSTQVSHSIWAGKFLSRIYSPSIGSEVLFNSDETVDGRFNFKKVLRNIEVKHLGNLMFKSEFDYTFNYATYAQRFFLKKVKINEDFDPNTTTLGRQFQEYKFDYNNEGILPARFSKSQDHLGYYNAKNNTTLLPSSNNAHFMGNADRSSDFETRSKGVLEKITYPTGGYTKIEYEAPLFKKEDYTKAFLQTYYGNFQNNNDDLEDGYYDMGGTLEGIINAEGEVVPGIKPPISTSQNVQMNFLLESEQDIIHNSELVSFDIIDCTNPNQQIVNTTNVILNPQNNNEFINGVFVEEQSFNFNIISGHYYKVILKINPLLPSNTSSFTAKLSFEYQDNDELVFGEGIRVKRVSDYEPITSFDTIPKSTKRYYYTKLENINKNPIDYVKEYKEPNYINTASLKIQTKLCSYNEYTGVSCILSSCDVIGHSGGRLESSPVNYDEQVISNYEHVTISYGGDNFENGGVEKTFGYQLGYPVQIIKSPEIETFAFQGIVKQFSGADWFSTLHGQLLKETIVTKEQNTFYKKQENTLYRSYTNGSNIIGHLFNIYYMCGPGPMQRYKDVTLGKYEILERKLLSVNKVTKQYLDDFPMTLNGLGFWVVPNEANHNIVTTTTLENYNSLYKGLPTEITVSTSESNKEQVIKNYYVDQAGSISGLTSTDDLNYGELGLQHIIGNPIQTESYQRKTNTADKLLSTQRTLYKIFNGNILPEKVQTSKGSSPLEDRVIYHSYDDKGNPLEVSKKDGTHIVYIWGYHQTQPIAKIENATYTEVESAVASIPNDSETIASIQSYSNTENSTSSENILRGKLDKIRLVLPSAQVKTFTYDPLIGVTSVTDPRGRVMYYEYDAFHRLKYIIDHDGNVISKKEYNYKR